MTRPDAQGDDGTSALPTLKAVASLHGILAPISPGAGCKVADDAPLSVPRVLVLHATADPFVPPEQVRYRKLHHFQVRITKLGTVRTSCDSRRSNQCSLRW